MPGTDSSVGVAPDGTGKKVATQEFTRRDGAVVEQQVVLLADPDTGRALDAPPWDELGALARLILVELRVLNAQIADETRTTDRELDGLRAFHEEQLT
jgi:hypothetical protein